MADHLVSSCLFTVRTTNLFIEIPVDEACSCYFINIVILPDYERYGKEIIELSLSTLYRFKLHLDVRCKLPDNGELEK